jgi:putative metalloprotease
VSRTSYSVRVVGSIEGDYIQACANHGTNTIDVTEGLIDAMDDDELAFVISHEVAHFLNQDNERTREVIDQGLEATVEATRSLRGKGLIKQLLGSVIILTAGVAGTFVASRLASQEHETEADQLALEYMQQAEYDPQSAISALEKLYGGSLPNYDLWEGIVASFIQTHPEPARRGRNILKRL